MRILLSGSEGQLARSIACAASCGEHELLFAARPLTDLSQPGAFAATIVNVAPDLIINAAAFTAVDRAEEEELLAHRINAEAAGEGAEAARRLGVPFVQISTDYVFGGANDQPWREDDPTEPVNTYGRSKLAGEKAVRSATDNHLIIRTSWLMSPFGHNFAQTMLRLSGERDLLRVVDDRIGSPTSALDLAGVLVRLAPRIVAGEARGTYHLANQGQASWADVAEEVIAAAGQAAKVTRVSSEKLPSAAPRPLYSVLDCAKARRELQISLGDWRDAVHRIVNYGG